ncbi:hypothetical protein SADUNF_Sadunf05G0008500 [Salix dunnii]|uniref:Disease resistance protein RGA3 n=1 Tax=Salix dunnii TaxID=1413687 RepID=A0A835K8Y0_9ROSI|nr:hypothetical protein SADUNF_Sadunf05G0008500 [Salix dunnii]
MAAELLLTFTMEETLKRVISITTEGIRLAWGLGGQLQRLNKSLTMIQAVLQDADRRAVTDESVKLWLERLKDVAYDAEDVLDEFAYEMLRQDQKKERTRETDSLLDCSEVIGREDDVSIVMDKLTSLTKQHVLLVVPIVGMAGLGKTTVAKFFCEIVRERKHFDVTLWVCVSNNFNKVKILAAMLQLIDKTTSGLNSLDSILQNLKTELEKKTFFLVLDDVWNEDHGKWDDLKEQLLKISSKNGNAIVVTTYKTEITVMMETSPGIQHKPKKLSDDECWSIIKKKVSGDGGATLAANLESVGKDIAKKCGGLPLLAKVLGGTLR